MALAHLWQANLEWEPQLAPVQSLCYEERTALRGQLDHKLNTPLTSSIGRLFDAAAALIGVRQVVTYESQAAIEMEALADPSEQGYYEFEISLSQFDPQPVFEGLVRDWLSGTPVPVLSARFHNSVAHVALHLCQRVHTSQGIHTVALSGGVWQNMFLLQKTVNFLKGAGFEVLLHRQTPANDGCIALGQAAVAAVTSFVEV